MDTIIKNENDVISMPDIVFKKANVLISAKYKSSLLENKVLAIAMSRIKYDNKDVPVATIHAFEIKKLLGLEGNSIYERLKIVAKQMQGRTVFMENDEKTHWNSQSIVVGADYKELNGLLSIYFNPKLKDLLLDLKISYTKYYLPLLLSFSSGYSYRLYELLKSKAYHPKGSPMQSPYKMEFGVNELKLTIGLVNTETDKVKQAMQEPNPDFDYIVENLAIEKVFNTWYDFKKYVLDVGIKEINENELSDIIVDYSTIKGGQGGKVKKIVFSVIRKDEMDVVSSISEKHISEPEAEQLMEMVESLQDEIDIPLKVKDLKALLKEANYDCEKVVKAYQKCKEQKNVRNVTGWMIDAIREDYNDTKYKNENKSRKNLDFYNFEQNEIDFDELEKKLLQKNSN